MDDKSRELPGSLKLITIWLLIVLALFLGFQAFEREQRQARFTLGEGRIELRRGADGHFHWRGSVNGVEAEFLVDTGATATALPQRLAERAGLSPEGRISSNTAGGRVSGYLARADVRLAGGIRAERLAVTVLPELDAPLLGMDLLGRLHFEQRDGVLSINDSR